MTGRRLRTMITLILILTTLGWVMPTGPAAAAKRRTWYHSETIGRSADGRKIKAYRAGQKGKPVVNPDGYARDRRWLKGGVDPNRNYPHRFRVQAHSGPRAASAKETRAMMKFLNRLDPKYVVSWHQPLHGVDSYGVKNKKLMKRLSKGLRLPVKRMACNGTCRGTLTGWFNANHQGAAITVEYGSKRRSLKKMRVRDANATLKAVGGRRA